MPITSSRGAFLRDNAFMVAAVSLPVVVAGLFILASAVPQWTVPPPSYDLLLKVARPYNQAPATVLVDFNVRNGRVEATLSAPVPNGYAQQWALLLFDHETMNVEEVTIDLPAAMAQGEPARTLVVDSLAARRVSAQTMAPDGYEVQTRSSGSPGIVGDLFGMSRYRQTAALVNQGRVVALNLPSPYGDPYQSQAYSLGWILDEGAR
jgi:hypothetical protein